jgi:hypothetical protein
VLKDEGIGIKELIELQVKPTLATPKYAGKITEWRDIGDPSMATPDQSTTNQSAAKVISQLLKTRFEKGATRWSFRINPTKTALTRLATDGSPMILISRSAIVLHRALNGKWHWKTDNSGAIVGNVPVKDEASHVGDMFTYAVSTLFPYERLSKAARKTAEENRRAQARARSYGPSAGHAYPNRLQIPDGDNQ